MTLHRLRALAVLWFALPLLASAAEVLTPGALIEIPNAKGEFDSLQVDDAKRRLLLPHPGNGTLDVIDLSTETVLKQIKTGAAQGVAIDPAKNRYYVSVSRERKLIIVDRTKLEILDEVPLPGPGKALCIGPREVNRVFVGRDNGSELWVIDPEGKSIVTTLAIPKGPGSILAEDDTSRVYQNIQSDDTVQVISAANNNSTVGGAWPVAPAKSPHGLALDLRQPRRLFVAGANGKLAVLNANDGKLITAADIVAGADQIAFDREKDRLYCPGSSGRMTVFDTSDRSIKPLGIVTTAPGAKTVAVDSATHAVWIAYSEGDKCFARKFTL